MRSPTLKRTAKKSPKRLSATANFGLGVLISAIAAFVAVQMVPPTLVAAQGFIVCGQIAGVTAIYSDGTVKPLDITSEAALEMVGKLPKNRQHLMSAKGAYCLSARPQVY